MPVKFAHSEAEILGCFAIASQLLGTEDLRGDPGDDFIAAGLGNDVIVGGAGNDEISGGEGFDRYRYFSLNDGIDTVTFDSGEDKIELSKSGFGISDLADVNFNSFTGVLSVKGEALLEIPTILDFNLATDVSLF